MSKLTHRNFVRTLHKIAVGMRKHYVALMVLAVAVFATLWYLGFDEFRHSVAFLMFERVLHGATHWATTVEEA